MAEQPVKSSAPSASATPSQERPACSSRLDFILDRELMTLRDALKQKRAPARSGVLDLILPVNPVESKKLNGMAIYAVQVFARANETGEVELPLTEIAHSPTDAGGKPRPKSQVSVLPAIFPVVRVNKVLGGSPEMEEIQRLLGTHTQILYGFVPLEILMDRGVIAARFKNPQTYLELLPTGPKLLKSKGTPQWLKAIRPGDRRIQIDSARMPDPKLTLKLLAENYCVGRGR
jgi:hypothetical protein